MRVGVTGAGGFTGRYLLPALARHGHEPVPIDADLTQPPALTAELADKPVDAVVHLAGQAFAGGRDYDAFYRVNQLGTLNLLEALAHGGRTGIPVLLASSAHVYGPCAEGRIDEEQPVHIGSHYALSKYAMELGAALFRDCFRLTVVRPFNYTGRGQEDRYLIPKIVAHFRARAAEIELGNIWVRRDIGDVRDVAEAYCGLLGNPDAEGVFNICTQRAVSVDEVIGHAAALTGHSLAVRVNPAFVRTGEPALLEGDNRRLRATLPDWAPRPIEQTIAWMLADED
jgi:GDP-6-deoxy-D-talose 4-dehydrogenase